MIDAAKVTLLRNDQAIANELRDEIKAPLSEVCKIMDRARTAGLTISFQLNLDAYGRTAPINMTVVKPL